MSSKLNILESKKLFKEFNYLMSDIEFKNEFSMEYSFEFEEGLRTMLKDEPIIKQACRDKFGALLDEDKKPNSPVGTVTSKTQSPGPISDSTDIVVFSGSHISENIIILEGDEQKIKHLYRNIVQKTHPDKVNSDALRELYYKATNASKKKDILTLYSICNELGISFNITDAEICELKKQNELIKTQQINFERSHLWIWVHSEDDNQKKEIIKHFLLYNAPAVKALFY